LFLKNEAKTIAEEDESSDEEAREVNWHVQKYYNNSVLLITQDTPQFII